MTSAEDRVPRIPWVRVIAEGTAIVLSILLAFAIDASWDARQAVEAEVAAIESLVAEVDAAIGHLDQALDEHRQVMRGAEAWEQVSQGTPLDSLARLVRLVSAHRTPNLVLSSVDALLASGRLSLVRDEALRSWIAAWPGVEEDFDEELQGVIRFSRFVVPDYFVGTGVPRAAADSLLLFGGSRNGLLPLVGDARFANLYYQAWEVSEVLVREGLLVRDVLEEGAILSRAALQGR